MSFQKYVTSLLDIRAKQVAEQEEEARLAEIRAQKLRYEDDDSDLLAMGIKKGTINSFLEIPYALEGLCCTILVGFFMLMSALPDNRKWLLLLN